MAGKKTTVQGEFSTPDARDIRVHTVNYAADVSGVCSALYELGGLIVMHDASGCNSTFATHDEPRWYDIDSMIYISGLTEYDAVLGGDEKYIDDVLEIAEERHPKFICVFGSPVALVMGTDFRGIAHIIEKRTGIPTFSFETSGMYTYLQGERQAFAAIADRFCTKEKAEEYASPESAETGAADGQPGRRLKINILGVTPLDFSVTGNDEALRAFADRHDMELVSFWAMGDSLERLSRAGAADVNLVVSSVGIDAAEVLKEKFGQPYVIGLPMSAEEDETLAKQLYAAAEDGKNRVLWEDDGTAAEIFRADPPDEQEISDAEKSLASEEDSIVILGETVQAASIRRLLEHAAAGGRESENQGKAAQSQVHVICPLEDSFGLLRNTDIMTDDEAAVTRLANAARWFIADPVWGNILKKDSRTEFIPLPSEACSGRIFRADIPVFADPEWGKSLKKSLNPQNDC
jgi:nitrogenase molybdenum-cofactor synthesis protein NifE